MDSRKLQALFNLLKSQGIDPADMIAPNPEQPIDASSFTDSIDDIADKFGLSGFEGDAVTGFGNEDPADKIDINAFIRDINRRGGGGIGAF